MDVTCKSCGTAFSIPDERLPPNQVVSVACPKCKGKIRIEPSAGSVAPTKEAFEEAGIEYEDDTSPLEFFEEGTKLALVLDGDEANVMEITPVLEEMSYKPILPTSINEAVSRLRLYHFDLIFLSDGFDGQDLDRSPITHYLNHLSMSIRRKIFLVLVSEKFKTMDNMMAFGKSANLVVNPDDLPNLSLVLKKAISDHEKFYKAFTDTLKEVGKE